jgi:D-glycerate 3-kinase
MSNHFRLDNIEYNQLLHLIDEFNNNKNIFLTNKSFFKHLEDKINDNNPIYKYLNQNQREMKIYEFFKIYDTFKTKFVGLYGMNNKKLIEDLYFIYIPLSRYIYNKSYSSVNPIIIGIQGHQGTGKTTFCQILNFLLKDLYELNSNSLSVDDIYLTHEELKKLFQLENSYKYRGPPGTHDLTLGKKTLDNVKNCNINYEIPRYDKSLNQGLGDRSKNGIFINKLLDVLIFEGWFLGVDPVDEKELEAFSNNSEDLKFQKIINKELNNYIPLWNDVDEWIILKPFKYEFSKIWRTLAEDKNKNKLDQQTIKDFIEYFWTAIPPYIYFDKINQKRKPFLTLILDENRNLFI